MRDPARCEIGSPDWTVARCRRGECPLHRAMSAPQRGRIIKACIVAGAHEPHSDADLSHAVMTFVLTETCPRRPA
jgi:hypothetical protein